MSYYPRAGTRLPAGVAPPPRGVGAPIEILSAVDVFARADLAVLADAVRRTYTADALAQINVPPRSLLPQSIPPATFISMPAQSSQLGLFLVKSGTFFERSEGDSLPSIHALVCAYATHDGSVLGVLEGSALTLVKCCGVAAVVTDCCAAAQARILAVIGAGDQAWAQVCAATSVRDIDEVRIYTRSASSLNRMAKRVREAYPELRVVLSATIQHAVEGADIVATATSSSQPMAELLDLRAPVHVNCMGAHTPVSREVPFELLQKAQVIVEDVGTAVSEAGPIYGTAMDLSALMREDFAELQSKLTIFSSTGHALLDLVTANHLLYPCIT